MNILTIISRRFFVKNYTGSLTIVCPIHYPCTGTQLHIVLDTIVYRTDYEIIT